MNRSAAPLSGVKVIDLSIYVAAPAATSIFGYLGADVIKVETPKGDPYRTTGAGFGLPTNVDENPLYDTVNSYKRGLCLDLRTDEGKKVMYRLIEQADIFITNFRENALEGMGMTYDEVKAINPRIVYGKGDGYGEFGPDAPRAGFDSTAFFARSGFADEASYPGSAPAITPSGAGDTVTSLGLGLGVLAAYIQAKETGAGCKVKTSLYTSALWSLASPIVRRQYVPRDMTPRDVTKPGFLAIAADFVCKDGVWVRFCGMMAERYWAQFCRALGLEDYIEDPRFCTSRQQAANAAACYALMAEKLKLKTYAEWDPIFRQNDLPFEKVMGAAEAVSDPQSLANNYASPLYYGDRKVYLPMPPVQVSTLEAGERATAPKLGENSVEILADFNFSEDEINGLIAAGAVKQC